MVCTGKDMMEAGSKVAEEQISDAQGRSFQADRRMPPGQHGSMACRAISACIAD